MERSPENHTEWHSERLQRRLDELVAIDQPWQNEERRGQIQGEMTRIAFEMSERYRETKEQEIEEAWHERT